MDSYRLYTVVPKLAGFWEELTNWYVRLNRDRMRGNKGNEDAMTSLTVLYSVLLDVTILFAPITPFLAEFIYSNLQRALPVGHAKKAESVHFVMRPKHNPKLMNKEIEKSVGTMQELVEKARYVRAKKNVSVKTPLLSMKVIMDHEKATDKEVQAVKELSDYIKDEVNVVDLSFTTFEKETQFKVDISSFFHPLRSIQEDATRKVLS